MEQINEQYAIHAGLKNNGQKVISLYKTHIKIGDDYYEKDKRYIKSWYFDTNDKEVIKEEINHEIVIDDWSRWNEHLNIGDKFEISECTYYDLLNCLPPHRWDGSYFEGGEPHHHLNNGKAIHRACWIEEGKFYTGYPHN